MLFAAKQITNNLSQVRKINITAREIPPLFAQYHESHLKIYMTFIGFPVHPIDRYTHIALLWNILDCHYDNALFCHFDDANRDFLQGFSFSIEMREKKKYHKIFYDLFLQWNIILSKMYLVYIQLLDDNPTTKIKSNWLWDIRKWQLSNKIIIF